ncbi:phage tail assembly chaperone [Pseudomonas sp. FP1742]|uniref:phage tail assembly chaperone n=1 Tax=Pseudomonas sp. FP1742 TaxID=2954079 RepID=UPI00273675B3|nr:phage tail assembly chaperone [Pseudomonas sp. FP1742]WLG49108.1 phage tail assembly chaperone [Pseudomonas sp. FP1742]
MASFKIAQNPTFKKEVEIPRVGADPISVEFEFKYRDRNELSAMFDKWNAAREATVAAATKEGSTWEETTAAEIKLQASQMKDIVVGWAFDDAFTEEAIVDLVTACVGAPTAVIDAYQKAYEVARRGN